MLLRRKVQQVWDHLGDIPGLPLVSASQAALLSWPDCFSGKAGAKEPRTSLMKMTTREVLWEMGLQWSQACFWKPASQQDGQGTSEQLQKRTEQSQPPAFLPDSASCKPVCYSRCFPIKLHPCQHEYISLQSPIYCKNNLSNYPDSQK